MSIYRGAGGAGDAVADGSSEALLIRELAIEVQADADAAAGSASSASTSATNAATSATNASNSASAAATSATNASNSASAASTSATNAANSATAAQTARTGAETAQTAAAGSATAAATSATNAAASATTATTQATNASNSATAAATSATNASNSATAASTSATNAANSATAAASSASSASTSASNASTSATNAAASATSASGSATTATTQAGIATTQATNAANSATAAATSATNASNSASAASTSESNAATSASTASSAASAALSALDSFDDRYLGAKSTAPTLDNDGDPLIAGALYFDTVSNTIKVYTGTIWVDAYADGNTFLAKANNLSDLNNASTARTNLGLAIGTNVQAWDADLDTWATKTAPTGTVVGTSDTQTLTNKTLTSPVVTGGSINNTPIGATTASTGSFTSLTDSGNLTFTGTGNRIIGDFSNLTPTSRVLFQTNTANNNTQVGVIPNGTNVISQLDVLGASDPTNASRFSFRIEGGVDASIRSAREGTGTFLPLTMHTGGSERLRIDTSGNVGIGTSTSSVKLYVRANLTGGTSNSIRLLDDGAAATSTSNNSYGYGFNATTGELSSTAGNGGFHSWYTANTERMRISSAGNVSIGTSNSTYRLQVAPSGSGSDQLAVFNEAGTWTANGGTVLADFYAQTTLIGGIKISAASTTSGYLTFHTGGTTERMRIHTNGNVSIGTINSAGRLLLSAAAGQAALNITGNLNGSLPGTNADSELAISTNFSAGNGEVNYFHNNSSFTGTNGGHRFSQRTGASTFVDLFRTTQNLMQFYTAGNERMRIDSSGNLLVGCTSSPSSSVTGSELSNPTIANSAPSANANLVLYKPASAAQTAFVFFNTNGSFIASINQNGNSAVSYNTTSDYRLKENIAPMTGALAKVTQLKPVTYTWKADGSASQGFIAHELQAVVPECVTGEKDAVDADGKPKYQGIDTSFLVATLTAAIQELNAKLDAQAARIVALESK